MESIKNDLQGTNMLNTVAKSVTTYMSLSKEVIIVNISIKHKPV